MKRTAVCFLLVICLLAGCTGAPDASSSHDLPSDVSSSSSQGVSSDEGPIAYKTTLTIPEQFGYSDSYYREYTPEFATAELIFFRDDYGDYILEQNTLYKFEKSGVTKVAELEDLSNGIITTFVIRGEYIYYTLNGIVKQNLVTGEKVTVYDDETAGIIPSEGTEKVFFRFSKTELIDAEHDGYLYRYNIGFLDTNDKATILEYNEYYNMYSLIIYKIFYVNNTRIKDMSVRILFGENDEFEMNEFKETLELVFDGKELYAVSESYNANVYLVDVENHTCELVLNQYLKKDQFAVGDRKIIYYYPDGEIWITDGVKDERLISGLPTDIVAWRIVDGVFVWYSSPDSYGSVELKQ